MINSLRTLRSLREKVSTTFMVNLLDFGQRKLGNWEIRFYIISN